MTEFVAAQGDFIIFISLFAFLLCAVECIVLNREEGRKRAWFSYFSFFLFESLAILVLLAAPGATAGSALALLTPFLRALAFGSLFAFVFGATARLRLRLVMVVVALALIAGCAAAGLLLGAAAFTALLFLVIGLPGVFFAARHFLSDPAVRAPGRPWLVSHVATFAAYGLVSLLQAGDTLLFGGAAGNELLLARVAVSILLGVSLSLHEWRTFGRLNRGIGRPTLRAVVYALFLVLPAILVGAWFLSSSLGRLDQGELRRQYLAQAELLTSGVTLQTTELDRESSTLSSDPSILAFLARRGDSARDLAESVLDGLSRQMPGTTFYLLDHQGMAVASSNRNWPISFVGHPFADMPQSIGISADQASRFLAFGHLSGNRGYYSISPVRTAQGGFLGWAVIKQDVESLLLQKGSISDVFLVDQNGIIFLSTMEEYSYRALWPVPEERQRLLASWGQFGSLSFNPILTTEPLDTSIVTWEGSRAMVTRTYLDIPGWSVIAFGSMDQVRLYRLGGLLVAVLVAFLVAVFSAAGRLTLLDEARIQRSETQYRTLVEGSPSWVSLVDGEGAFLFTNFAGWKGLGASGAPPQARRVENILGPENAGLIAGQVRVALRTGPVAFELVLPSASGEARTWRITFVPVGTADSEPTAILFGNDITDMRRAEARLVRAERMAALGTLTGGIAHQFNNINAVALGYVQVLEMEPHLPEKAKSYLRAIRDALERSVEITTRLLALTVPQAVVDRPLLLDPEVRSAMAVAQEDFDREGVTIKLDLEEGLTAMINPEQLRFVLNALLVNAWHAVLGQATRRVRVISGKSDSEVFLRVEDTGIGIAKDDLSSLFTPFFSQKGEHAKLQSPQTGVRGVGLSLAVVHSIVTGKGGRIEVESERGVGSAFTVWLPRPAAAEL